MLEAIKKHWKYYNPKNVHKFLKILHTDCMIQYEIAKDGNAGRIIPIANIVAASICIRDDVAEIFAINSVVKQGANLKVVI